VIIVQEHTQSLSVTQLTVLTNAVIHDH